MSSPLRFLRWAVVGTMLAAPIARGSTMVALPTEKLFAIADVVAVATVQHVESVRTKGRITTHVTLAVTQAIKGVEAGAFLKVLSPGGQADGLAQLVIGAAEFSVGETDVVFLKSVAPGVYHVVGLEQGKLTVQTDASGTLVVRRTATADLLRPSAEGGMTKGALLPPTEPLDGYLGQLRDLAGADR